VLELVPTGPGCGHESRHLCLGSGQVCLGRRNGRWTYDFWLAGQRYQGYCVDPATNSEAKNRREATEIESTLRRSARQTHTLTRKGVRPGTYTLALTCQAALDNRARADPAVTFSPVMTGIVVTADHTTTVNIS